MTGSHEDYYLISEVSRLLNVPPHRIIYPLITRQLPEPERIGGRRVFTWDEIVQIAEKLGKPVPQKTNVGAE